MQPEGPPPPERTTDQRLLAEVELLGDTISLLADRVAGGQPERIFSAISQLANSHALAGKPKAAEPTSDTRDSHDRKPGEKSPEVFGFADRKDRVEAGPTYGFGDAKQKPTSSPSAAGGPPVSSSGGLPPLPPPLASHDGSTPPIPPVAAAGGGLPSPENRDTNVLEAINRGVWQLVAEAGKNGTSAKPEAKEGERQTGSPASPMRQAFDRTRVGGIWNRFQARAEPHVQQLRKQFGGKKKTGSAKQSPGGSTSGTKITPSGSTTHPTSKITTKAVAPKMPGSVPLPKGIPVGAVAGEGAAGAAGAAGAGGSAAAGAAGAAGAEGAAAAGAMAAGAAIPIAGVAIAATFALVELGKASINLAHQQEEQSRRLAEYSPGQAQNVAELDMGRVQRNMELGEDTAGSSQELMQSLDRLEKALLPLETAVTNATNAIGSVLLDTITDTLEVLNKIYDLWRLANPALAAAIKLLTESRKGEQEGGLQLFGDQIARGAQEQDQRDRQRREAMAATRAAAAAARRGF